MSLLPLHILAGLLALAAGAVAMSAAKGGKLHRKGGLVFVYAMLFMTASGAVMAAMSDKPGTDVSVIAGLFAFYLVGTAFLTVRRPVEQARGWIRAFMLLAVAVGLGGVGLGVLGANTAGGKVDGVPGAMYAVFGSAALLSSFGDLRLLRAGSIEGARRLTRHLWRMGVAMFIATASFFLGQADEFPAVVRATGLLPIPVLLVIGFTVYWLLRMRWQRRKHALAAQAR